MGPIGSAVYWIQTDRQTDGQAKFIYRLNQQNILTIFILENLTSKPLRFETETLRLKKILNLSRINETSKMLELHQEKLETKNLKSESEITEEILKLETSLNEAKHIPCKTDFQELKEKTDSYKPKRPCSKPWKAEKPENTKKIKKNKCLRDSNEEITPQLENENKKFECNYCGKKFRDLISHFKTFFENSFI